MRNHPLAESYRQAPALLQLKIHEAFQKAAENRAELPAFPSLTCYLYD